MNDELPTNPISLFSILYGKPFDYQADFLMCNSNRIVFRSGRQVGKTTMCAVKAIQHATTRDKAVVIILSPTQRQSGLMFRKIRALFKHKMLYNLLLNESQTMITLKNGSEIHSLPGNNPDTIRGFSPTLLMVDEAAFVKDEIFVSSEPSLAATNGQMILTSTPFGKSGRFYQSFNEDIFAKFHIPSKLCPLITAEFLENQKASKTEFEYLQEFEGEFIEEADNYFPRSLVASCIADIDIKEQEHQCDYYLGVDCARFGTDETVYCIAQVDKKSKIKIIFFGATSKKPITDIIGRVQELNNKWGFRGVYIDETGLGGGAVDVLKEKGIPLKNLDNETKGVTFTLESKEIIYKNLKYQMEKGMISFPKHEKLISQLCDMQYEFTEGGHIKIHHPDSSNAHDDFPDALALAVAICRKKSYKPYIA